ncbi:MAG: hypothetical protein ACE1ZS_01610, partial [Candidatus Poribacteria bacterium]
MNPLILLQLNVGDFNYRVLRGGRNQFEIRLNQHQRATFTVDDAGKVSFFTLMCFMENLSLYNLLVGYFDSEGRDV